MKKKIPFLEGVRREREGRKKGPVGGRMRGSLL